MMSPVRVSDVVVGHPRDPEVRQLGDAAAVLGSSGQMMFDGLTSRWMTPRAWACSSAPQSGGTDPHGVAIGQLAVAQQLGERATAHELGDEVDGLVVAAGLVQRDDRGVRQPRGRKRLALAAPVGIVLRRRSA